MAFFLALTNEYMTTIQPRIADSVWGSFAEQPSMPGMHKSTLKAIGAILLLSLVLSALSACRHVTVGFALTRKQVAFVKPGVTTRSEVLENLKEPLLDLPADRTMVYVWQTRQGLHPTFGGEKYDIGGGSDRWLYCIRFDADDRVMKHETIRQHAEESPIKAAQDWLTKQQAIEKR
jgi:outer membrane protein assembly factor BamE (lipoprotein component of BamABCDE complex)